MRPVVLTVTGTGVSNVYPTDHYVSPFNVAIGVVTDGITYTIQHTFDDVFAEGFDPTTATWFDHATLAGLADNADGNYAFPVRGIRLSTSGSGTASATVIQAGMPGRG